MFFFSSQYWIDGICLQFSNMCSNLLWCNSRRHLSWMIERTRAVTVLFCASFEHMPDIYPIKFPCNRTKGRETSCCIEVDFAIQNLNIWAFTSVPFQLLTQKSPTFSRLDFYPYGWLNRRQFITTLSSNINYDLRKRYFFVLLYWKRKHKKDSITLNFTNRIDFQRRKNVNDFWVSVRRWTAK